jgi:hypothetical protein
MNIDLLALDYDISREYEVDYLWCIVRIKEREFNLIEAQEVAR